MSDPDEVVRSGSEHAFTAPAEVAAFLEQVREETRLNIAALEEAARFRLRLCIGKGWPIATDRVWLALTAGATALQLRLESERTDVGEERL